MNATILTSIIAAAAACLGALVPCLFSYLGKKKEYQIARIEQIEQIRRTEYSFYLDVLQQMINESNRDNIYYYRSQQIGYCCLQGPNYPL